MRIKGFHAKNYLSFQDFHMTDLDDHLNILVGPNGSGKSNILYGIEQVVESVCGEVKFEEFHSNCNFSEADDYAEIALDVEFNEKDEQKLLDYYICYSLFTQTGFQDLLSTGPNQINQLNRSRLQNFIETIEQKNVGNPSLSKIYSGKICVTLSNTIHPLLSVYYRFKSEDKEHDYFWYLNGNYNNVIGKNQFRRRSQSWSQTDIMNAWIKSLGEDTTTSLRRWLINEIDEAPLIDFDFNSIMSTANNYSLFSLGGMNNHMGSDPEIHSYGILREILGNINDPTNLIQSNSVFQHLLKDTVVKTSNIHVEPKQKFDYMEWEEPSSSLLDGSGLALYLFRLKNGLKTEREEFERICNSFSKLTGGRKLNVQLKTVVEYTNSLMTFPNPQFQRRLKPRQKQTILPSRESKAILHLELTITDQQGNEFSISRSGAGMFEICFLCTVLSISKSHVVLLDEPGTHVHASIQRQLAKLFQQVNAQVFVITHSPYLLSAKSLETSRRIYMEDGRTRISTPFKSSANLTYRLRNEQAFERDPHRANSLFSNLVILVDGESEYHALPIWFQKYCEKREYMYGRPTTEGTSFEDFNVSLVHVGGKKNYPSYLRFINSFNVPWLILCDGDSLSRIDNICKQLREFNIDTPVDISFCETKDVLRTYNVFVLGENDADNFETIPEVIPLLEQAKIEVGKSKAHQAQWIAEQTKFPATLGDFFSRIIELSQNIYATPDPK